LTHFSQLWKIEQAENEEETTMAEQRKYTSEFKAQAVKLAREVGQPRACAELGIPKGTISGWMRSARQGEIDLGLGSQTPESGLTLAGELKACREKLKQQEKEIARLRKENEFLDEASRFFAQGRKK
jgi:transposase